MSLELTGCTVLVTGAASGIGRSIATELAAQGSNIVCCDVRREPRLEGLEIDGDVPTDALIVERGGAASFVRCDVTNARQVCEAFAYAAAAEPPLWGAVLAAGVFVRDVSILDETVEEHDGIMAVNERGVWLGLREGGRALVAGGRGGRLVCIASISGLVGLADEPAYCSSKGAVVNLVRAAALDLAAHSITVNAVCPGFVATAMLAQEAAEPARRARLEASTPLGRLGTPADVAAAVSFLVSSGAGYVTGAALPVDGGYTCR